MGAPYLAADGDERQCGDDRLHGRPHDGRYVPVHVPICTYRYVCTDMFTDI